ncbi:MAG: hypothetical protein KC496_10565, partial [Anaerolineae bacterium]|nr:hypothetical protein [Anaerolineae bacterium]
MTKFLICSLPLILFLVWIPTTAQQIPHSPAITAENIVQLQSVQRIDFADYDADFEIGWFALNASGDQFVVSDSQGTLYRIDEGQMFDLGHPGDEEESYPGSPVDVAFDSDGHIYAVQFVDGQMYINFHPIDLQQPVGAWAGDDPAQIFVETAAVGENPAQIVALTVLPDSPDVEIAEVIPYAPGEDEGAVVRIGRIPRPYAVTSSLEGMVKLWNLETGNARYEVDNGTGEPSVFGAI